ncbi:hypothetical protein HX773_13925 [Pantoea sp. B9002]|uniref:hypothetical protein n=1 Tax=Pantoea sp. B9002 TaxID=2726979 RepID=UPI0015A2708F|nr:hypothetical protein [Pantoea sp. B9002]NWA61989.1 hypothetical protein [Pantoea sp. B9002]
MNLSYNSRSPEITAVFDNQGANPGYLNKGDETDDLTPVVRGTAESFATVELYSNSVLVGSAVADANGLWNIYPTLSYGENILTVSSNGNSGNSFRIDIYDFSHPRPVKMPDLFINTVWADDNGQQMVTPGNQTSDPTPQIYGFAPANQLVTLYANGVPVASVRADSDGQWMMEPELANGVNDLHIEANGLRSQGFMIEVDGANSGVQPVPSSSDLFINTVWADEFNMVAPGNVSNDNTPKIYGFASVNQLVTLYANGVPVASVRADSDGQWMMEPELTNGVNDLHIEANGLRSQGFMIEVDGANSVVQPVPSSSDLFINTVWADEFNMVAPGNVSNDNTPKIYGFAPANQLVTLYANGVPVASVRADSDGQWMMEPELTNGVNDLHIEANGIRSQGFMIEVDGANSGVQPVPSSSDLFINTVWADEFNMITPGGVAYDITPKIYGFGPANQWVTLYANGELVASVRVDSSGQWMMEPKLNIGTNDLHVESDGIRSQGFLIEVNSPDNNASLKPVIEHVYDDYGVNIVNLSNGAVTQDSSPIFTGKAAIYSWVDIKLNGEVFDSVLSSPYGFWEYGKTLPVGTHEVTVSANGVTSDPFNITITPITAATRFMGDENMSSTLNFNELLSAGQDAFFSSMTPVSYQELSLDDVNQQLLSNTSEGADALQNLILAYPLIDATESLETYAY